MKTTIVILTGLLAAVTVLAPVAAQTEDPEPNGKLKGEVVAVRTQARVHNQGEVTEIQVQTQTRERYWLQLGPAAQYGDAAQVGDQVRVRVMAGAEGEPAMVQNMFNYRSGERLRIRDRDGEMIQQRLRDQTGSGSQAREQERHSHGDTQGVGGQSGGAGGGGGNKGGGKGGR